MGTQNHANDNYRRVVELIQSGAIGAVREVHVWHSRAWGWHENEQAARDAKDRFIVVRTPKESNPIPKGLNWDLWQGPAPARPFHNDYFPGPKWYRWWDFGNGTMSDLGSHLVDLPFWALKLEAPLTVEARGPKPHHDIAPASMQAIYEYGARGELPPVKLSWYQGLEKPQIWKDNGIPQVGQRSPVHRRQGHAVVRLPEACLAPRREIRRLQRAGSVHPALAQPFPGLGHRMQRRRSDTEQL